MKRMLVLLALAAMVATILPAGLAYAGAFDQEQTATNYPPTHNYKILYGNAEAAQSFKPGFNYGNFSILLLLKKVGTPPQPFVLEIRSDNNGAPSSTVLMSETWDAVNIGTSSAWYEKAFGSNQIVLTKDVTYWVVCYQRYHNGDVNNRYDWEYYDGASQYARGLQAYSVNAGSSWTTYPNNDFCFRTWAETNSAPPTPSLSSPANSATGVALQPTLNCNGVTDPDGNLVTYVFQVATASDFNSSSILFTDAPGSGTGTAGDLSYAIGPGGDYTGSLSAGTTYYWRVYARDDVVGSAWSGSWSFTTLIPNQAPPTPTLFTPANTATGISQTPVLYCNTVVDPNGDPVVYMFQLDNNSDFSSPIFTDAPGSGTGTSGDVSYVIGPGGDYVDSLSAGTTYYWRVYARDAELNSAWSISWSFTTLIPNQAPPTPTLNYPMNGTIDISQTLTLFCTAVVDPNGDPVVYVFQVATASDFNSSSILFTDAPGSGTGTAGDISYEVGPGGDYTGSLSVGTTYYWRVYARDATLASNWSSAWNFTTTAPPFSFVHISDLHVAASISAGEYDLDGVTLGRVINGINALSPKPAFVVATGDICHAGEWSTAQYPDAIQRLFPNTVLTNPGAGAYFTDAAMTIPVYFVPGNHDYRETNVPPLTDTSPENYPAQLGPLSDYVIDKGSAVIVGINSGYDATLTGALDKPESSGLTNDQMAWLHNQWVAAGSKRKIVFMHNPAVADTGRLWDGQLNNDPPQNRGDGAIGYNRIWFLNQCDSFGVNLVLTGHEHQSVDCNRNGANWTSGTRYIQTAEGFRECYRTIDVGGSITVSAPQRFNINKAPPTPALSSPASGVTGISLNPTLYCRSVADPNGDPVVYVFQLADNSSFYAPIFTDAVGSGSGTPGDTSYVLGPAGDYAVNLSAGTTYYWRVFARDALLASGWSSSRYFATLAAPPSVIGTDGYFYLNGTKTIMKGIEEERRVLTNAQVDDLIPRLHESGINLIVLYQNQQTEYFYQQMQAAIPNIWIAQHFGTVKKELIPLPGTGGVVGTTPDPAWFKRNADSIRTIVTRLRGYNNILFWWLGGEFVEPIFNMPFDVLGARSVVRAYIGYLRDTLVKYDNTYGASRPFTVSHHNLEIHTDGSYFNYSNLTDFTWFTAATHMHNCDLGLTPTWGPLFSIGEYADFPDEAGITTTLNNGVAVNGGKPIFMGGWYGNSPATGECALVDQYPLVRNKWNSIKNVLHNGYSTYHLDQWEENNIPHRMMEWNGSSWSLTPAGNALKDIIKGTGPAAYWMFNESSFMIASDATGNGNAGILTNFTGTYWVPGKVGNALSFDGVDDYVSAGNPAALRITGSQTIAMWICPHSFAARSNPYNKAYGGEGTITVETNGTVNYYYGTYGGNGSPYQGFTMTSACAASAWTHLAIVRDLRSMKLRWYKNGVETDVTTAFYSAATTSGNDVTIGSGYDGCFDGLIDEVRVYNRALSATEITALFNSTTKSTEKANEYGEYIELEMTKPVRPTATRLLPCTPNPITDQTIINYQLAQPAHTTIKVYNISGQLVKTLASETKPAGDYSVRWDGKDDSGNKVVAGVYLYRLQAGEYIKTNKMTVLR